MLLPPPIMREEHNEADFTRKNKNELTENIRAAVQYRDQHCSMNDSETHIRDNAATAAEVRGLLGVSVERGLVVSDEQQDS